MARHANHIVKRDKTYSVRVMIPKNLRHHYNGSREEVRALGTSNLQTAKLSGFYAVAEIRSEFSHLRTTGAFPSVYATVPDDFRCLSIAPSSLYVLNGTSPGRCRHSPRRKRGYISSKSIHRRSIFGVSRSQPASQPDH